MLINLFMVTGGMGCLVKIIASVLTKLIATLQMLHHFLTLWQYLANSPEERIISIFREAFPSGGDDFVYWCIRSIRSFCWLVGLQQSGWETDRDWKMIIRRDAIGVKSVFIWWISEVVMRGHERS